MTETISDVTDQEESKRTPAKRMSLRIEKIDEDQASSIMANSMRVNNPEQNDIVSNMSFPTLTVQNKKFSQDV